VDHAGMIPIEDHARSLWTDLSGVPVRFVPGAVHVAAGATSLLCPPGWAGIVRLGDAVIATAPDEGSAAVVRRALHGLAPGETTDPGRVRARLALADVLGPATLAYAGGPDLRAAPGPPVERRPDAHDLIAAAPADEAGESGLDEITSDAFVVRDGRRILAAAGYERWPLGTAHIGVLTAPDARGRGLARVVAAAAVRDAFAHGLVAQWRARPAASRRVALALGFRELGAQLSVRLADQRA